MKRSRFIATMVGAVVASLFATTIVSAQPQSYPDKAIKLVVPFSAGGLVDVDARRVALHLGKAWGKPVIVENKPGAGGVIAIEAVVRANHDGYTLLYGGPTISTLKVLIKNMTFDPLKDLVPISTTMEPVQLYATNVQSSAKSLKEFLELARANPGKLNYGSAGRNSTMLVMEGLKYAGKISLVQIPFPGESQYVLALMRDDVQIAPMSLVSNLPLIQAGKLRVLAVGGEVRAPQLPDVPTAIELGYDVPSMGWFGLFAPAGTPKDIVEKISAEIRAYEALPETREQALKSGYTARGSTPDEFKATIQKAESAWERIAKFANIQPE